jgi:hypothetical protein
LAWVNRLDKRVCLGAKKEKKKETPIRSMPLYIRAREEKRQALGFPADDLIRD